MTIYWRDDGSINRLALAMTLPCQAAGEHMWLIKMAVGVVGGKGWR